jgi:hypothetical protein
MNARKYFVGLVAILMLPAAASAAEVRGYIVSVDVNKGELVLDKVRPKTADTTFAVTDKTPVSYGKTPGTVKDLPIGRLVIVDLDERDGKHVVAAIRVTGRPPVVKAAADSSTVSGTLRRVALTDREIVVIGPGAKGPETETTIAVSETARVLRDGKAIPFEELKEGEAVTVTVEKRDSQLTATTLQAGMAVAAVASAKQSSIVPKLRLLLRIADGILQRMEKQN